MADEPEVNVIEWKPFIKQESFLSIPLTVKEGFYAGAVNAGKTDVLLMYPIVHSWHKEPKFKGLFLRRTMPELRNEVIPRSKEYYEPYGAKFNASYGIWEFPSGALIFFGHCENENDVHNYDTAQWNYVAFDELTSFTEWQYIYITIERVRRPRKPSEIHLPAIVRSGSNPGNIGHTWVKKRFIDPYPNGNKILKGRGGVKRVYIPATIEDNPYADPVYKAELDALPEAERRAKKLGDWSAYEGQVFDEFRERHYPDEPENALHCIDEFDIPSWWPRLLAIDWGYAALSYALWGAVSPTKRLYVYREQAFRGKKIEEWAPEVKFYVDRECPKDIVICHSAGQHRGEPHTILEQVSDALGKSIRLGEKDRIGGKQLLHEYLRWKIVTPPVSEIKPYDEELAAWILRNKGLEAFKLYGKQYLPIEPETNIPKLQLFRKKIELLPIAIKACVYEADKDGKKKEDVKEFDGDDPYDTVRMLLHSADIYFGEAKQSQEEVNKIQAVVNQYEQSQDMTAFYRNMRHIESEQGILPVRLISNRHGYYSHRG